MEYESRHQKEGVQSKRALSWLDLGEESKLMQGLKQGHNATRETREINYFGSRMLDGGGKAKMIQQKTRRWL